jgi:acyl carrier protein
MPPQPSGRATAPMTSSMSTADTIRAFIVDDLGWDGSAEDLTDDVSLFEAEILDSMGIHQMVAFIEEEFDIEVADEDLAVTNFESVGAIARLVETRRQPG